MSSCRNRGRSRRWGNERAGDVVRHHLFRRRRSCRCRRSRPLHLFRVALIYVLQARLARSQRFRCNAPANPQPLPSQPSGVVHHHPHQHHRYNTASTTPLYSDSEIDSAGRIRIRSPVVLVQGRATIPIPRGRLLVRSLGETDATEE